MSICPICGQPKMHTRLWGSVCHNRSHAQREADIFAAWLQTSATSENFINSYPEPEREAVRRVIEDFNDSIDRFLPDKLRKDQDQ